MTPRWTRLARSLSEYSGRRASTGSARTGLSLKWLHFPLALSLSKGFLRQAPSGMVLSIVCWFPAVSVHAQTLATKGQATGAVIVRNVSMKEGVVTGEVMNSSPRLVRDVRLLIRHTWFWNDERHPGTDSPGRAGYYTVSKDIPTEGRGMFTYRPEPPLPERTDGHFETSAEVVGFTEVGE